MGADRPGTEETERLRAELAHSERMRRALADVIITLGSNLGLGALLERVCSIIDEAYESIASAIWLWDPEIERLVGAVLIDKPFRSAEGQWQWTFLPPEVEPELAASHQRFIWGRSSLLPLV